MKIQELAIILLIIILPISIVLSAYTQFQIKTLDLQTAYDTKLTSATYDAIKAFQINTANSTLSDLSNSKLRDIEASVQAFKNSMMSTFGLNGYTEDDLNQYIPALVYTMYDGFYIYSPYENTNYLYEYEIDADGNIKYDSYGDPIYKTDISGNKMPLDNNGETMYGLKPYITYTCEYKSGSDDFTITYSLDNYIVIQGMIGNKYVNKEGYLIDGIAVDASSNVTYNGVSIPIETELKEWVWNGEYPYVKINGTKYYYDKGTDGTQNTVDDSIFYISNGQIMTQGEYKGQKAYEFYNNKIKNNNAAVTYYKEAMEFTNTVKPYLQNLKYSDAIEYQYNSETGEYETKKIWENNDTKIFQFNGGGTGTNIENEKSSFNQHRYEVIKHKIESNLSIAIANYNNYSNVPGVDFQMPKLTDDEWYSVIHNISLISFVQGLNIGGKDYNGYAIVNNSESKEVVLEQNIYILGIEDSSGKKFYFRIGDKNLESGGSSTIQGGRLNLDFKRTYLKNDTVTRYYYPLRDYYASYTSIVTQTNVTTYDDIYAYVNSQNDDLKKAFYTALGRERQSMYKALNTNI